MQLVIEILSKQHRESFLWDNLYTMLSIFSCVVVSNINSISSNKKTIATIHLSPKRIRAILSGIQKQNNINYALQTTQCSHYSWQRRSLNQCIIYFRMFKD